MVEKIAMRKKNDNDAENWFSLSPKNEENERNGCMQRPGKLMTLRYIVSFANRIF